MVRFAIGLIDGKNTLGKCGGAAVSGSKNLKAIVVYGSKGIRVSDPKGLVALYDKSYKAITENSGFKDVARYGIIAFGATAFLSERDWHSFTGKLWQFVDKTWIANQSCIACPFPCRSYTEVKDGRFAGLRPATRHFVRSSRSHPVPKDIEHHDFGPRLKLEDTMTRLGLDMYPAEGILDYFGELYERGEITEEDTDGLVLRRGEYWGTDVDTSIQLLERIASREGDFARCLGEGWHSIADKFGMDPMAEMSICKGISTIM